MECLNCNKEHDGSYGSGKFCSQKCARAFSTKEKREEINKKVSKTLGGTGQTYKYICFYCGKEIRRTRKNRNNIKFCNNECRRKYSHKEYERMIVENKTFQYNDNVPEDKIRRRAKQYLIEKNGHKCQMCGTETWFGNPVPLVFDHIDGNSDNNLVENCRIICRNCDGLLPTFTYKNIGKGRSKQRAKKLKKYSKK